MHCCHFCCSWVPLLLCLGGVWHQWLVACSGQGWWGGAGKVVLDMVGSELHFPNVQPQAARATNHHHQGPATNNSKTTTTTTAAAMATTMTTPTPMQRNTTPGQLPTATVAAKSLPLTMADDNDNDIDNSNTSNNDVNSDLDKATQQECMTR
ncbi:hypothetical protein EDB86DRAFT_2833425 [Lactarius hatsudake]|nr:hypothetical protein EDB86DRAFT_2833425 [Lactarius hatsudake]